jgi:hypothetical protein
MTFSINVGLDTQANYKEFDDILNQLFDNDSKHISPQDIRDAVFSTFVEPALKPTGDYIGIDTLNPADRDSKLKQFYGKRHYLSNDIMTDSLLLSDTDIFFYNTKSDIDPDNISTKLSFLSGTDYSLFDSAPYVEVTTLSGTTSQSYDWVNFSNDININTSISKANINGITFSGPTATPTNNDLMFWSDSDNSLVFRELTLTATSSIGATGSTLSLVSGVTKLNGYPLEFTDLRPLPKTWNDNLPIGSVNVGESINTMLYKLIYSYLPPLVTLELCPPYDNGYIEIGKNVLIPIKYTIVKRTKKIIYFNLTNLISSTQFCPITQDGFITQTGILNGVLTPGSITNDFTLTVIDEHPTTVEDTTTLTEIYPYFNGFSDKNASDNTILYDLDKVIEPKGNKSINIFGSGYYYFMYDSTYGDLSQILDDDDNPVTIDSNGYVTFNSVDAYWGPKEFRWYRILVNEISPGKFYKFNY